jgi:hypothetical protein
METDTGFIKLEAARIVANLLPLVTKEANLVPATISLTTLFEHSLITTVSSPEVGMKIVNPFRLENIGIDIDGNISVLETGVYRITRISRSTEDEIVEIGLTQCCEINQAGVTPVEVTYDFSKIRNQIVSINSLGVLRANIIKGNTAIKESAATLFKRNAENRDRLRSSMLKDTLIKVLSSGLLAGVKEGIPSFVNRAMYLRSILSINGSDSEANIRNLEIGEGIILGTNTDSNVIEFLIHNGHPQVEFINQENKREYKEDLTQIVVRRIKVSFSNNGGISATESIEILDDEKLFRGPLIIAKNKAGIMRLITSNDSNVGLIGKEVLEILGSKIGID